MSVKNMGTTTNYREIMTWLYEGTETSSSSSATSPRVVIEPGETKQVSVTYNNLKEGVNYKVNINYSRQFGSWSGAWLGSHSFTFQSSVKGDANGDDAVDIADAVSIVNYVVGKPNTNFNEPAADVNNDGVVDIADAVHIVNFVVGKISTLSRPSKPKVDANEPQ